MLNGKPALIVFAIACAAALTLIGVGSCDDSTSSCEIASPVR